MTTLNINEIAPKQVFRIPTGFVELDALLGYSDLEYQWAWFRSGLPTGAISVWAGESGVGKSRLVTQICKNVNNDPLIQVKILVFQGEVNLSQYKNWVSDVTHPERFFVSDINTLEGQLKEIDRIRPNLVVLDSINMLDGFNSPTEIRHTMEQYRLMMETVNGHAIFIAHQDKQKDVKGNTDIPHLADIVIRLNKIPVPKKLSKMVTDNQEVVRLVEGLKIMYKSFFALELGKNRFGSSGGRLAFQHKETGVEKIDLEEFERTINQTDFEAWCSPSNQEVQPVAQPVVQYQPIPQYDEGYQDEGYMGPYKPRKRLLWRKFKKWLKPPEQFQYAQPVDYIQPVQYVQPKRDWTPVCEALQDIGNAAFAFVAGAVIGHYTGKK
jgi:archaellum biogenesis ATPase FlaH